ncbi:IDEAL domain-containing protein [Bacillus sp. JJ1609]|uniref:IDEAL domain-containing protein n=1 Tax=Bacillus sp. JJ1609 TaxID=3122977 RepID=UPI0030002F87
MANNNAILCIGDWIKAKSREGELIIGYVESFDLPQETTKVTVTTSDHQELVGKTIPILNHKVKRLPNSNVKNKEQILNLIDLALTTGDEDWFLELSSKLNAIRELVKSVK